MQIIYLKDRKFHCAILLLICMIYFGCREDTNNKNETSAVKSTPACFESTEKEKLIVSLFDSTRIKNTNMDPAVKSGQKPLRILESKFFPKNLNAYVFGNKIKIVDSALVDDEDYRVEIKTKNCKDKSLKVQITNPYEGLWYIEIQAYLNKEKGKWELEIVAEGIAD